MKQILLNLSLMMLFIFMSITTFQKNKQTGTKQLKTNTENEKRIDDEIMINPYFIFYR